MRNSSKNKPTLWGRIKNGFFPVVVGTALFLTYPSIVSYQDIASLSQIENSGMADSNRWLASLNQAPGLTNLLAGIKNKSTDPLITHAVLKTDTNNLKSENISGRIIHRVRKARLTQTVNRSLKGDRVVSSTTKAPPNHFTAGSVVERHSFMAPLNVGKNLELAFVKAMPAKKALHVAAIFHPKKKKIDKFAPKADLPVLVASLVKESAPNILAYSSEPQLQRSPFAEILEDDSPINIVPRLGKGDHKWADDPLPKAAFSKREQHCLTAGIYFESRGEPVKGQAAVSQVILNRVKNPAYPNSICGVVYQNKNWRNRCQFSFACDRIKDKVNDRKRWNIAQYVARETSEGRIWLKEVGSSTHYHAAYVRPKWAKTMKRVGRIGLHIFYRTYGGGWS